MVLLGKIMILQGVGHPISCLGVCYGNDPQKGGYTTPAPALDLTTSLRGDFVWHIVLPCHHCHHLQLPLPWVVRHSDEFRITAMGPPLQVYGISVGVLGCCIVSLLTLLPLCAQQKLPQSSAWWSPEHQHPCRQVVVARSVSLILCSAVPGNTTGKRCLFRRHQSVQQKGPSVSDNKEGFWTINVQKQTRSTQPSTL